MDDTSNDMNRQDKMGHEEYVQRIRNKMRPLMLRNKIFLILFMCVSIGLGGVYGVYHTVRLQENESLRQLNIQFANDYAARLDLKLANSILRVQLYEDFFGFPSVRSDLSKKTLKMVLPHTLFKRASVFRLKRRTGERTVHTSQIRREYYVEIANTDLPQPSVNKQLRSEAVQQAITQIDSSKDASRSVFYEMDGKGVFSFIWRSRLQRDYYYVFSTPLQALFENANYKSDFYVRLSGTEKELNYLLSDRAGIIREGLEVGTSADFQQLTRPLESLAGQNSLEFRFKPEPRQFFHASNIILIFGFITIFLFTFFLWFLLVQNHRITRQVISRTHDLEAATHSAIEAVRSKSRFLANISHEVRTPLNLVLGMMDLLEEGVASQKHRVYLKSAKTAGGHLLSLIEDLAHMSKLESDEIEIKFVETEFLPFVEEVARLMGMACHDKKLKFYLQLDPDIPSYLNLEPVRTRQILLNLLKNSVKYTEHGHVILKVSRSLAHAADTESDIRLRFEIEDSGVGISKERLPRIFERFFQLESTRLMSEGGVGLGLTIVKDLVERLSGNIDVTSKEGQGSLFVVEMPMKMADGDLIDGESKKQRWIQSFTPPTLTTRETILVSSDSVLYESIRDLFQSSVLGDLKLIKWQNMNGFFNLIGGVKPYQRVLFDLRDATPSHIEAVAQTQVAERVAFGDRNILKKDLISNDLKLIDNNPPLASQILSTLGYTAKRKVRPIASMPEDIAASLTVAMPTDLSILIADDDSGNRELFRAYLESLSWKVTFATNGQEALDSYKQSRPDVVVTDVRMPVMDGFTLLNEVRAFENSHQHTQTPFVFITADVVRETAMKISNMGGMYLTKPVRKTQLVEAIKTASSAS